MSYKKTFWFGILIWIVLFVVASALLAYGWLYNLTGEAVLVVFSALLALILAGYNRPASAGQAIIAGVAWVVIGVVLDLLITRQLAKAAPVNFFTQWSYWLSYLLILIAPLFRIERSPDQFSA